MQIEINLKKFLGYALMSIGAVVVLYGLYYLSAVIYIGYVLTHQ